MDFEDDVFDDVFEDDRYDSQVPDRDEKMLMEQLEYEQSLISRKLETNAFSVDRTFVNSIEYHRLFDELLTHTRDFSRELVGIFFSNNRIFIVKKTYRI